MTVLGIETSTAVCGVCVLGDTGVKAERSIVEAHVHSEKLLTLVREVFDVAKIELKEITAVAVSIGPGSFTGLRIGLSSAKGLCYALEKPLVVVPTFDGITESVASADKTVSRIAIALDAKQGEYYVGTYSKTSDWFVQEGKVDVLSDEQTKARLQSFHPEAVVTDVAGVLEGKLGNRIRYLSLTQYCRAESIALLGLEKVKKKEVADLASVEPMYLKDFVVKMAR